MQLCGGEGCGSGRDADIPCMRRDVEQNLSLWRILLLSSHLWVTSNNAGTSLNWLDRERKLDNLSIWLCSQKVFRQLVSSWNIVARCAVLLPLCSALVFQHSGDASVDYQSLRLGQKSSQVTVSSSGRRIRCVKYPPGYIQHSEVHAVGTDMPEVQTKHKPN